MEVYGIVLLSCSPIISSLLILCCLHVLETRAKKEEAARRRSRCPDVELGHATDPTKQGGAAHGSNGRDSAGCGADCGGGCGCDD
ncbi:hypothetical protein SDJN03_24625, partial [Cucurbita argyrosperma subsp. sororia]